MPDGQHGTASDPPELPELPAGDAAAGGAGADHRGRALRPERQGSAVCRHRSDHGQEAPRSAHGDEPQNRRLGRGLRPLLRRARRAAGAG